MVFWKELHLIHLCQKYLTGKPKCALRFDKLNMRFQVLGKFDTLDYVIKYFTYLHHRKSWHTTSSSWWRLSTSRWKCGHHLDYDLNFCNNLVSLQHTCNVIERNNTNLQNLSDHWFSNCRSSFWSSYSGDDLYNSETAILLHLVKD